MQDKWPTLLHATSFLQLHLNQFAHNEFCARHVFHMYPGNVFVYETGVILELIQ